MTKKLKKRIWFNRWFSTGIDFIDRIKEMDIDNQYEIYVTHHREAEEFVKRADYFAIEKACYGEKYIEFCMEFCKKNNIEIFIPKFGLSDISKYRDRFDEIGVKVMLAGDNGTMELVRDKVAFYKDSKQYNIVEIPEYYSVETVEEFEKAYKSIKSKNKTVCYKTVISEGGLDFRVVYENSDEKKKYESENLISFEKAVSKLKDKEKFDKIMVMEFLNGTEYSIDCLAYNGELLAAIPRKKVGWSRILENKSELIEIAKQMTKIYNFSYVFNIQVRYLDGVPKLLEVNPRMSGGLNGSCMSGINFPHHALKLLIKGKTEVPEPKFGIVLQSEEKKEVKNRNMKNSHFEKT